jgi:hypothetical protein
MDSTVLIGDAGGDRVVIEVLAHEGDDWLSCRVSVNVAEFAADFTASFGRQAFAHFYGGVVAAYRTLTGSAVFRTIEDQLELDLEVTKLGGVNVRGMARTIEGLVALNFEFGIDQSYLPAIWRDLERILERY